MFNSLKLNNIFNSFLSRCNNIKKLFVFTKIQYFLKEKYRFLFKYIKKKIYISMPIENYCLCFGFNLIQNLNLKFFSLK